MPAFARGIAAYSLGRTAAVFSGFFVMITIGLKSDYLGLILACHTMSVSEVAKSTQKVAFGSKVVDEKSLNFKTRTVVRDGVGCVWVGV